MWTRPPQARSWGGWQVDTAAGVLWVGGILDCFLPTMVRRSPVFCEPAEGDGRQRDVFPLEA